MSNVSVEEKKAEALSRMKELGINGHTIRLFAEFDKINFSEPPSGAFFLTDDEDLERIRAFERQYNALVFIVIRNFTADGTMDSYLFVSDYPEEWPDDRRLLREGEATAYVYNHDAPYCSEIGSIGIAMNTAYCLRRIW